MLPGAASKEGTKRFAQTSVERRKIPAAHFRPCPGGFTVSSFGLGTYIGRTDSETDRAVEESVRLCLASGRVNVLDTAINYRYQRAERSVGRALVQAVEEGTVRRDQVVVATKNGYFAPDAESSIPPERWVETELIRRGVLRRSDVVDGCHAMSVPYLRDQFERSRRNLGLESIDVLYLHNAPDAELPVVGHEEFLSRLDAAFRLFASWRSERRLGFYGLATWDCLRVPRSDPGHFSLAEAVDLARSIEGDEHGLRFIQFPFNLMMPEAASVRNQVIGEERLTLFAAAQRLGVGCFTSVPLFQGQLASSGPISESLTRAQTAIQFARSVPGTLGPLVGQKTAEHLSENLQLADVAPWSENEFAAWMR